MPVIRTTLVPGTEWSYTAELRSLSGTPQDVTGWTFEGEAVCPLRGAAAPLPIQCTVLNATEARVLMRIPSAASKAASMRPLEVWAAVLTGTRPDGESESVLGIAIRVFTSAVVI